MQEVLFNPNESINVKQDTVVLSKAALQNDIKEHNCNFCHHNYAVFEISNLFLTPPNPDHCHIILHLILYLLQGHLTDKLIHLLTSDDRTKNNANKRSDCSLCC